MKTSLSLLSDPQSDASELLFNPLSGRFFPIDAITFWLDRLENAQ